MLRSAANPRPIILLNPGRQSRHYMLGILRAAGSLGLNPATIDIGPIRAQIARAQDPEAAFGAIVDRLRHVVESGSCTDIITYANSGGPELMAWPTDQGTGTIWTALGLRHHILWTDHPEWATDGMAITPSARRLFKHPNIVHRLKSRPAAEEASAMLGWPGIQSLPVAEDYSTQIPDRSAAPVHDAVAILGSVAALPETLERFLAYEDPNPAEMDRAMIPQTIAPFIDHMQDAPDLDALRRFAGDLLEARAARPFKTIWQHTRSLEAAHPDAVAWITADPERWYRAQGRLRQQSAWRRSFWLAWTARRVDLGVYGCDASALGITQPDGAAKWVPYDQQSTIYARGRCALNINQSHDESGVTHKPFQIVAAGVPLVHHAVAGLTELFTPGHEILVFARGPELLHRIDSLCARGSRGADLAQAALARARSEHAWTNRLESMLGLEAATATATRAAA